MEMVCIFSEQKNAVFITTAQKAFGKRVFGSKTVLGLLIGCRNISPHILQNASNTLNVSDHLLTLLVEDKLNIDSFYTEFLDHDLCITKALKIPKICFLWSRKLDPLQALQQRHRRKNRFLSQKKSAEVDGSCMAPIINRGDIVVIEPPRSIRPGDIAVFDGIQPRAHRIIMPFTLFGVDYVIEAGDRGKAKIALSASVLGKITAVKKQGAGPTRLDNAG